MVRLPRDVPLNSLKITAHHFCHHEHDHNDVCINAKHVADKSRVPNKMDWRCVSINFWHFCGDSLRFLGICRWNLRHLHEYELETCMDQDKGLYDWCNSVHSRDFHGYPFLFALCLVARKFPAALGKRTRPIRLSIARKRARKNLAKLTE